MSTPDDNSRNYLSKLTAWSKSPSIPPSQGKEGEPEPVLLQQQKGADHAVSHRHRLSLRRYPKDCPRLWPQWFHAVDVPKRRPDASGTAKDEKPIAQPKKYTAFSTNDSKAIEAAFQKLLHEEDADGQTKAELQTSGDLGDTHLTRSKKRGLKVPVNEDYLFDVDVEKRELAPAYWHGPVYDVRRGTWFYSDGSVQKPCDENLSAQLEEGYLKVKAWRLPTVQKDASTSTKPLQTAQPRSRPASWTPGQDFHPPPTDVVSIKGSSSDLRKRAVEDASQATQLPSIGQSEPPQNTHRLFGAHMNSVVTYQDGNTAWLQTDDFLSRMNYTVYQRFTSGFAGVKITRGYVDTVAKKTDKDGPPPDGKGSKTGDADKGEYVEESKPERLSTSENIRQSLQRQMSALLDDPAQTEDRVKQEEEARKRDEREIEDDYREAEGDKQGREIEHLILVTHGIGQRLGLRLESINFVHDVNTLRKTLKAVYADSPDLRALNAELDECDTVNSRVQVLPICWRNRLDFPRQSLRHNRMERDLGDTEIDDDEYPNLEDITVEGVPAVRNLITDLALDILLYDSPIYKDHISGIVLEELNRIYHLFMERNPMFNGKVHFVGHSLGSAIMFDILCRQDQPAKRRAEPNMKLDFPVEDFYALGSPIGLFQMLGGRTIIARPNRENQNRRAGTRLDEMADAMLGPSSVKKPRPIDSAPPQIQGEDPVAQPKCAQIFNIFHPTDPISYRIEPLISPAMASLKPQPLPYTKRGIFGAPVGQGLTGIGARVSQSVSSMWTSMASSLLTRGLGYGEDAAKVSLQGTKSSMPLSRTAAPNSSMSGASSAAGANVAAGVVSQPTASLSPESAEVERIGEARIKRVAADAQAAHQNRVHPPTLIDGELTTLYGDFEKRRKSVQSDSETRDLGASATHGSPELANAEECGKKLRKEEEKVRRLNSNGRVDYAIQEGAFDINLIAAIASHLSYWSDEDVSHFIISQLLSRHRIVPPCADAGTANLAAKAKS